MSATEAACLWPSVRAVLTRTEFCSLVGISRSTLWRRLGQGGRVTVPAKPCPIRKVRGPSGWEEVVRKHCREFLTYGYRRVYVLLSQGGGAVGQHRIRRFMRSAGLSQREAVKDTGRTVGPRPPEPIGPNQAWQIDATKIHTNGDGWVWQTSILDVFDRRIVAHVVRKTCRQEDAMDTLARALDSAFGAVRPEGLSLIHDRGSQFTGWAFKEMLDRSKIKDVTTAVHHPQSCGRLERWHRTLKEECIWQNEWETLGDVDDAVWRYVRHYNNERIHSALNYKTPMEIYRQFTGAYTLSALAT